MPAPDPLRTELPEEIRRRVDAMAREPRPHQIPIDESRRLKRESGDDRSGEQRSVGRTAEFRIPGPAEPVPIRLYVPEGEGPFPMVLWLHGGGFVRGGLEGTDALARFFANRLEATIVTVDYRLAPEHTFPAALEDTYAALRWIAENPDVPQGDPDRLVVGGTSAGGNLAAATALLARDRGGPAIARQVLGAPMLDPGADNLAREENGEGYGLTNDGLRYYWAAYLRSDIDRANAYACPARAHDLSELPPTTLITAGFDPLRDEGIAYGDRLTASGVPVEHLHYPAMPHHLTKFFRQELDPAVAAWEEVSESLRSDLH